MNNYDANRMSESSVVPKGGEMSPELWDKIKGILQHGGAGLSMATGLGIMGSTPWTGPGMIPVGLSQLSLGLSTEALIQEQEKKKMEEAMANKAKNYGDYQQAPANPLQQILGNYTDKWW